MFTEEAINRIGNINLIKDSKKRRKERRGDELARGGNSNHPRKSRFC